MFAFGDVVLIAPLNVFCCPIIKPNDIYLVSCFIRLDVNYSPLFYKRRSKYKAERNFPKNCN